MKKQTKIRSLHLLFIASLVSMLIPSMVPIQAVHADGITTTSDLKVRIVSIPRRVKACQTFKATFSVKNLGPDPASNLYVMVRLPDPFELVVLNGAPTSLKVGQSVTFSALVKVVAFVPGEPRRTWIGVEAMSDPYPNISIDPNLENNPIFRNIRMVADPVERCP
ncbi:MAG: hypothetical protein ACM33V_07205 [Chloroflexota bacterium]